VPGERTWPVRLKYVVELAGGRSHGDIDGLVDAITKRAPTCFVYMRWSEEVEARVPVCSSNSVRRTVDLATSLGLLHPVSAALSTAGKRAVDPARFDSVLRAQIAEVLESAGCPAESLLAAAARSLRAKPAIPPTIDVLFGAARRNSSFEMAEADFGVLVRLFAAVGGIRECRRAIYLPSSG